MSDDVDTTGGNPLADNTPNDAAAWITKLTDADVVGASQTKGWDKLDPVDAFYQAAKAHRNAEKMLGVSTDQLVRLPKQDDEQGWRAVWQRLGAPDKPEGYDLTGLELGDPDKTARFHETVRTKAAELGMPKAMAEELAKSFHKFVSDGQQRDKAEQTAQLQAEQQSLVADWGEPNSARFRANMFIADQAAEKLGISHETLAKLKDGIGAADVARMLNKIGIAMGEDKFVAGTNPANQGLMSREQAIARKNELMRDKQWVDRYLTGGGPEVREMTSINMILAGG